MRHGSWTSLLPLIFWTAFLISRVLPGILARRKRGQREKLAETWPAVAGTIRNGSVQMTDMRWRLTLTYDSFDTGHGIELWEHDFPTKLEAEHAAESLAGLACPVHYNPERVDDMTLLWSDVSALLAREPFVPRIVPLSRVGYRWLVGLAAVAVAGLTASVVLLGIGMSSSSSCVCDAITGLMVAAPLVGITCLVPMFQMMVVAPRDGIWSRMKFLLPGWRGVLLAATFVVMIVSFFHYAPMLRALPMNAEIPDRVYLGTMGGPLVTIYLFAVLVTLEALRRLQPVEDRVRVSTVV